MTAKILSKNTRILYGSFDLLTAVVVVGLLRVLWSASAGWPIVLGVWAALLLVSSAGLFLGAWWGAYAARVAAYYQLAFFALLVVAVLSSAAHLWGVYGQIGTGIAVALLLVLALSFQLVALLPLFKLRSIGAFEGAPPALPGAWPTVVLVSTVSVVLYCASVAASAAHGRWQPTPGVTKDAMARYLWAAAQSHELPAIPSDGQAGSSHWVVRIFDSGELTARLEATGSVPEATQRIHAAMTELELPAAGRRSVAIDRVVAEVPLRPDAGVLTALSVVPGLDGVSGEVEGERFAMTPRELVWRRMLSEYRPVPFIPEFEIGVDVDRVRAVICEIAGQSEDCSVTNLRRARTEAWVYYDGETRSLYRGRPFEERRYTTADAMAGARAAGNYVLRALQRDGRFQYKLVPHTGKRSMKPYSIPRHAGTSWFLLQLYEATGSPPYLRGAEVALDWLATKLQACGDGLRCIVERGRPSLGQQALPLIAFATQARATGSDRYAETIENLAAVVLRLQREDGDFDFFLDRKTGQPIHGGRSLYAAGQGALGLALAGQVTGEERQLQASRRALDFMAGPYWDFPLSNLFFIEEHWSCLAAEEVFRLFGEPEHARFCVDAAGFDLQLQHRADETVFPDYAGGIGFSPFFPPYTTSTAGRAEGMIAAYEISKLQGKPDPELRRGIAAAVEFLLHNQYRQFDAYAFPSSWASVGGVPWNYYDPMIRIDTVQHAGSVMLRGAELLPEVSRP